MHSGITEVSIIKVINQLAQEEEDHLTVEEPLQISLNQMPFTITMRTPGHDAFLARGILFTENIIVQENLNFQYQEYQCTQKNTTRSIDIEISEKLILHRERSLRSLLSNSSCGVCGKIHLTDLHVESTPLIPSKPLRQELIFPMLEAMQKKQEAFSLSGGIHGAAAFSIEGDLLEGFEDIGRHNAVDKVVGALLEHKTLEKAECLTVSGRVSYEILTKAYRAKIPYLIAVSAPSSLAVEMAVERGITLIGFSRGNRFNVYSNQKNLG